MPRRAARFPFLQTAGAAAVAVALGLLAGHRPAGPASDPISTPSPSPTPEPPAVKAVLRKFAAANLALFALWLPAPAAGQAPAPAAAPKAVVTAQVNAGSVLFDARASVSSRPPIWQAVGHPDILLLTFDKGERRDVIAWAPHLDPGDYFFSLACVGAPDASGVPAIDVAVVSVTIPGAAPPPGPVPVPPAPGPGPAPQPPAPVPAAITEPLTAVQIYDPTTSDPASATQRRSMSNASLTGKLRAVNATWIAVTATQARRVAAELGSYTSGVVIHGDAAGVVAVLPATATAADVIARIKQARGTP